MTIRDENAPPAPEVTIRAYRPADREAVRAICRQTAFRNLGSDAVFEDGELFADYFTAYYTDHEPESCLVAERDGKIVGYLTGCVFTRRMIRVMGWRIVPSVLSRMIFRYLTGRYRKPETRRAVKWFLTRSWREAPPVPVDAFPTHYHCNVLRDGIARNVYSRLAFTFLDLAVARGSAGIHGQIDEPAEGGLWRRMVENTEVGYAPQFTDSAESTFLRDVLGIETAMVNRVWAGSIPEFRFWLTRVAKRYRL